jgi:hypothetical protein
MFAIYFKEAIRNTEKLNYNYLGISRKDYPKWQGWRLIATYKEKGLDISEIKCKKLDILVQNFYYLKYIKEKF